LSTNNSANRGDAPGNLTIGEGVKVVGQLVVPGLAVINGTLQGELQADELLVGPKGSLSGQVRVRRTGSRLHPRSHRASGIIGSGCRPSATASPLHRCAASPTPRA